jgi:hypothetical protein
MPLALDSFRHRRGPEADRLIGLPVSRTKPLPARVAQQSSDLSVHPKSPIWKAVLKDPAALTTGRQHVLAQPLPTAACRTRRLWRSGQSSGSVAAEPTE